jgi:hypothetical protein
MLMDCSAVGLSKRKKATVFAPVLGIHQPMLRWILLLICGVVVWAAGWPLVLGIAALHTGLGVADYGPLFVLSAAMYCVAGFFIAKITAK